MSLAEDKKNTKPMRLSIEQLGECQVISRRDAALEQIHSAIKMHRKRKFASAITLALAAESQLPEGDTPALFATVKSRAPKGFKMADAMNQVRNWLKHTSGPDEMELYEFEVFIALARATTKFTAVYKFETPEFLAFQKWARSMDYTKRR